MARTHGSKVYDAAFIGGGHNALVCAAYLAKKGLKVGVYEKRALLGGVCVTEEIDGVQMSRTSYVYSLFHPKIVRDLDLHRHGLELIERDPPSFTPFADGRYLFLYNDMARTQREIAKFSIKDAHMYPKYEGILDRISHFVDKNILLTTPPNPRRMMDLPRMALLAAKVRGLGDDMYILADLFSMSAYDFVSRYFESDILIATLCTDGIIGAMGGPKTPGTAYVLLHHVMGEVNGNRGRWGYVRNSISNTHGMGGLTHALAYAGAEAGVEYHVDSGVKRILLDDNRAFGLELENGQEIRSRYVVSGADPHVTFEQLLCSEHLPEGFRHHIENIDYRSATSKVNFKIDGELVFKALRGTDLKVPGTFHLGGDADYMEQNFDAAKYGRMDPDLILEGCVPSVVDGNIGPNGERFLSLLIQYTPYDLEGGWTPENKARLERYVISKLDEYTNFSDVYTGTNDILTPVDLEREFSLTGGNLFHGAMGGLSDLFVSRPVPGFAQYRSPVENLWMCGSSTHPGGGITGIPGHNCAREMTTLAQRIKRWF